MIKKYVALFFCLLFKKNYLYTRKKVVNNAGKHRNTKC